jgi:adenosylcobinamide kinase/adenosylcobinamide-phosphate guanylyltransferase
MMTVVTGGSGSGKSAYAEELIRTLATFPRYYIATMYPFDEESYRRIDRHRAMRKEKKFETVECYTGLKNLTFSPESTVLLECMSNLTANEMFQEGGAGLDTVSEILEGIRHLRESVRHLVVVTNEIFSEAEIYEGDTERYREYLGEINCRMAEMADEVVEVVYGIPVYHKRIVDSLQKEEETPDRGILNESEKELRG